MLWTHIGNSFSPEVTFDFRSALRENWWHAHVGQELQKSLWRSNKLVNFEEIFQAKKKSCLYFFSPVIKDLVEF